jgi:hypothetical protein
MEDTQESRLSDGRANLTIVPNASWKHTMSIDRTCEEL